MNIKRQDAGRMGGLQTVMRYGVKHYSDIGRLGGRPRLLGITGIRQQLALEVPDKQEGGMLPTGLRELKELFKLQNNKGEVAFA